MSTNRRKRRDEAGTRGDKKKQTDIATTITTTLDNVRQETVACDVSVCEHRVYMIGLLPSCIARFPPLIHPSPPRSTDIECACATGNDVMNADVHTIGQFIVEDVTSTVI